MKVEGRIFIENRMINCKVIEHTNSEVRYSKELEQAFFLLCRELDIPVPLWLQKNTHEFAAFGSTIFFAEQFTQDVYFDRFQFKLCE